MSAIQAANPTIDARKLRLGQKVSVPPAPAAARQVQSNDSSVYVVKSGDMLGKIAQKFKTTVKRLREVNNLPSDRIRVGQKLKLPTEALR
jgi:LysM repeat protein